MPRTVWRGATSGRAQPISVQRERSARSRSKTQIEPESPTNIVDYLNKFSGALLGNPFQEGSRGAVGPNRLLAPSVGDRGFPLFDTFWGQRFEPVRGGVQLFDLRSRCAGARVEIDDENRIAAAARSRCSRRSARLGRHMDRPGSCG